MEICQHCNIQLQKEVKSNPQTAPQGGYCERRCEIQGGGPEMAVMVG